MADVRPDPERGAQAHALQAIWQEQRAGILDRVSLIERAVSALTAGISTMSSLSTRAAPRTR